MPHTLLNRDILSELISIVAFSELPRLAQVSRAFAALVRTELRRRLGSRNYAVVTTEVPVTLDDMMHFAFALTDMDAAVPLTRVMVRRRDWVDFTWHDNSNCKERFECDIFGYYLQLGLPNCARVVRCFPEIVSYKPTYANSQEYAFRQILDYAESYVDYSLSEIREFIDSLEAPYFNLLVDEFELTINTLTTPVSGNIRAAVMNCSACSNISRMLVESNDARPRYTPLRDGPLQRALVRGPALRADPRPRCAPPQLTHRHWRYYWNETYRSSPNCRCEEGCECVKLCDCYVAHRDGHRRRPAVCDCAGATCRCGSLCVLGCTCCRCHRECICVASV